MTAIHLGQWIWNTAGVMPHWKGPGIGAIDLRSLSDMGTPMVADGFGIFALTARDDMVGRFLGEFMDDIVPLSERRGLGSDLGIGVQAIVATTPRTIIEELLIQHADPQGLSRLKPLMPTRAGMMEIHLGGYSKIWSEPFDPVRHPHVLQVVQGSYRRVRRDSLAGKHRGPRDGPPDLQFHRRYLQGLAEKYGRWWQWEELIPPDLPREDPLSHDTTVTDDFSGDLSNWTQILGTWGIVTAHLEVTTDSGDVNNSIRHNTSLAGDDHYAEAKLKVTTDTSGAVTYTTARFTGKDDWYGGGTLDEFTDSDQLEKNVAATRTSLGTNSRNWIDGETGRLKVDGSSLDFLVNGVSKVTATDTAHTGQLLVGCLTDNGSPGFNEWDDFEAADLAAGVVIFRLRIEGYR